MVSKFALTGLVVGATHLGLVTVMVARRRPDPGGAGDLRSSSPSRCTSPSTASGSSPTTAGYALHLSRQGLRYLFAAGLSYAGTSIAVAVLPDAARHPRARRLLPGRRRDGVHQLHAPAPLGLPRRPGERRVSRPLVSVVVPCLNEEDNVGPLYERAARDARRGRGRLRGHLQPRPLQRRDRGPHPRDPAARPRGEDAPAVAALRPARRHPGGHPHGLGRRRASSSTATSRTRPS